MIVLLDTNILLDVLANRQPYVAASRKLWELSELSKIEGVISAISFNNIFYIVRKAAGNIVARECLRKLRAIFRPIEVDERILNQAIDSPIEDFEDAIQYFTAFRAGASYLVTRNPGDFPKQSPIPVLTAEMFISQR
ncbi:MAG TPA: PIN domain-containing protein [Acidobacteriota bacterium]